MDPDKETEPAERLAIRSYRKRFSRSADGTAETEGSETAAERAKSLKCLISVAGGHSGSD